MATQQYICADWRPENTECKKAGRYSCKNCYLVTYCGPNCQKSHWPLHKIDCKSSLGKKSWTPDWVLQNRKPAFMTDDSPIEGIQFGKKKYLWGNVPALDVLQLGSNEGEDYEGKLRLLFAASGDFRNIVKTIAQIPLSYNQALDITINDRDLDIVARNVIMLLVALVVDDIDESIDCIIHVWYSALIRQSDLDILQGCIRPLIENVCDKIGNKESDSLLGKTWTFGQRSLRLVLKKASWHSLLSYLSIPDGLTAERARQIRAAVVLADCRKDYRDRNLLFQSSSCRIAKSRYWEDGLLLPFGSRRHEFQEPNPTFFQSIDSWPMQDSANPLHGWSSKDVEDCSSGPAAADIYGKLFYHVSAVLRAFLLRLSDLQVSFALFQMDVSDLPEHLEGSSFSRIEVSNISDDGYLGIHHTVCYMTPLLQEHLTNPHATLITLFMNAVDETITDQDKIADMTPHSLTTKRLLKYLPPKAPKGLRNSYCDPELMKFSFARDQVATYDHIFDRYMKRFKTRQLELLVGAIMKERHSVIEEWPFRLKLRPGQSGAQEEFDRMLGGGVCGKERYMEWKRTLLVY